MEIWLIMLAGGLITFAIRLSFIVIIGERDVPPQVKRILRFVPPAVLSAIILPEMFLREGVLEFSPTNPRLLAGILAALVAWKTKSVALTIAAGMTLLLVLQRLAD